MAKNQIDKVKFLKGVRELREIVDEAAFNAEADKVWEDIQKLSAKKAKKISGRKS